ncbi:iron complex transport system substrate-binding protein [Saccharopolyspora lacisalsi]|uniref:Iron complex transport system substrate-binding protein n=1 Tax=Halosaccharopolyspora lacisalsi TaxID=1000566 RepID=A0A839E430_9PSEU|nr:ABC transporter substrate-binding protein [Halosaccharopolyspora lacisalsi]MBA8826487.1 iron complex transport system substrate-binding protein [Halosaccharopolyspora lacisalsi]
MFSTGLDSGSSAPTRRHVLGGMGMLLLTAACGPSRQSSESSGESAGFPVTVEHRYGTTEIPAPPRRVVTVGLTEQDYVLALGSAPVAAREWFGDHPGALWPWATDKLGQREVPASLPRQDLDVERIAALRPDLVLGMNSGMTEQQYDALSRFAPTIAQPGDHPDYGAPWQELTRPTGRALGRTDQAGRIVANIEQRFEHARTTQPEFRGATGLLATSINGSVYAYATGPAPRFLNSLGFTLPAAAEKLFSGDADHAPVKLSLEHLGALEADVLLLGVYGSRETSIAEEPIYRRLDVARRGRDIPLPQMSPINGALSFSSALSLPIALDELVPRMAKAIDGDPATKPAPVP